MSFLLINGCSTHININDPLTAKNKIDPQKGVVVVRVINASSYPLPFNYLTIAPKNLHESKDIKFERLMSLKTHTTDSNIYSSAIKAGSYSLNSITSFHQNGDFYYSRGVGADITFGTFEVVPGKVTDLGSIIYYPMPQDEKYINKLTRFKDSKSLDVLNKFFPFYQSEQSQVLTWNEDGLDEERQSEYFSIVQNPVTFNHKYAAPDGSIYFIGKLGVIIKRTVDGDWEIDAVDTNVDLNTIQQTPAGDIIVAGNEGAVFYKKPGGEWQDVSLKTNSNVKKIEVFDNSRVELLSFQTNKAEVYRSNLSESLSSWKIMASFTSQSGWKDKDANYQEISLTGRDGKRKPKKKGKVRDIFNISTSHDSDKHIVTITYGSNRSLAAFGQGISKHFTYDPDTWEVKESQLFHDINTSVQAGNAKLMIEQASYWSWTGMPSIYKINDNKEPLYELSTKIKSCKDGYTLGKKMCLKGDSFVKIKSESFSFVSIPWFLNAQEAFSIASFRKFNLFAGPAKIEYEILKTTNGGKNWFRTELELPNEYCMKIVPEVKDKILLSCSGVSGDFYESADFGETWQHVRQHENF